MCGFRVLLVLIKSFSKTKQEGTFKGIIGICFNQIEGFFPQLFVKFYGVLWSFMCYA